MMVRKKTLCSAFAAAAGFLLLVLLPGDAAEGAKAGLQVCGGVIVPSLFPFLVFSALLSALGLPEKLAGALSPLFRKLGLPPAAAAPLLLGLLGGYPVGASALADLVHRGQLTPQEAERLLPCCNNTGPAFIIGAAGSAVFRSAKIGLGLYLCHVLAAVTLLCLSGASSQAQSPAPGSRQSGGFAEVFPDCVRSAAASTVNICAFVVFFSVLTALLRAAGIFTAIAVRSARLLGTSLQLPSALLTGILELGGGIAAMRGLPAVPGCLAVCAFLLGFGGLSVHCQTRSVLSGT